jgi:hypothetical protein
MLIDSSVARSFAVIGWTETLVAVCGESTTWPRANQPAATSCPCE